MPVISHIDVAEEERIKGLLDAPGNHSWPAIDSESMDGWVPDMGLTPYANYSVYRPPSVVAAGVASTIRHRFRVPSRNPQLPGTYFLGALIYDEVGYDFPLEVSLGSEMVGRIEATRHDNRRHLLVIDRPIEFNDRVKWVQFATSDGGPCRIERFVMLTEAPAISTFTPQIERVHVEPQRDVNGEVTAATLHCVTYPPATLSVKLDGQAVSDGETVTNVVPTTLHALRIPSATGNATHTLHVTATDPAGSTTDVSHEFRLDGSEQSGRSLAIDADVELCCLSGMPLAGMPLTFGVPVGRGQLFSAVGGRLAWGKEGDEQLVQTRAHARWPDGSVRWALVDGTVPAELPPQGRLRCRVSVGAARTHPPDTGLTVKQEDDGVILESSSLRVSVRPTAADWLVIAPLASDGTASALTGAVGGGVLQRALRVELPASGPLQTEPGAAEIEHQGPQRATMRLSVAHTDAEGVERLRSELRLHVYADQSFVTLAHRLVVVRADTRDDGPFEMGIGEERALLAIRSCSLYLPFAGGDVLMDSDRYNVSNKPFAIRHKHEQGHTIEAHGTSDNREGRTAAQLLVEGRDGGSALVALRGFWQNYPKGISVGADSIQIEILPERSGDDLPGDEDAWHQLYTWLPDDTYLLREGMALTTEMCLGAMPPGRSDEGTAKAAFAWLNAPVLVRPSQEYTNATEALPYLSAKAGSERPGYERMADQALQLLLQNQEDCRAFGHVNFGDWFGEGDWSWGNNEYDTPYVAYWEFLRGGDPGWAAWGAQAARHLADIDTVNTFHDQRYVGMQQMHTPAHLAGYLPAFFRSKIAGTRSVPSHMWAEGALLHYLLTGDEGVHDSLRHTAGWLVQPERLDHYEFAAVREAGWHLIHLTMLAASSNDRRALDGASILVKRILEKQDASGAWTRMLTSGHCHCGFPHCRGNISFMVTVLLSGLKRYYDLTEDAELVDAIVAGGRWLIRETFNQESGHFVGGSCRTVQRLDTGDVFGTQIIIEGIADAYAVSGDEEIGRCLQRALPAVDELPELTGARDLGKRISSHMRYVPTVLAALESHSDADGSATIG